MGLPAIRNRSPSRLLMKFARVASIFVAAAAVFASPASTENDNSDVMEVLKSFQLKTQHILPQITLVAQSTNNTQIMIDVKPLLKDLTAAANAAVGSLQEIKTANGVNRPVDPAVANLVSSVLTDITSTLNNAGMSSIVHPDEIIALDDPLSILLDVLEAIMMGTLALVGVSVVGVSALLLLVGLGLVLGALGL